MRDILFRGKAINRIDGIVYRTNYKNGDWVYGLVTRLYDERFEYLSSEMTNTDGVSKIEVDYKTVGQYTGVIDKNGTKIFEGDILKYNGKRFVIKYLEKYMRFSPVKFGTVFAVFDYTQSEIIGNIYDNPELLEVEND